MAFFAFLFFIVGILSGIYSPFLLLLGIPLFLFLFFYQKKKNAYLLFLFSLLGFLLIFLFPKGEEGLEEIHGIVIQKKDTYFLLLTWKGKYYIRSKDSSITLFSILKAQGYSKKLSFTHYESVFDFKGYLKAKGVFHEFSYSSYTFLFHNPISEKPIKKYMFSYLEEKPRAVISSLLTGESILSYDGMDALDKLGLLSSFSLSGFHISFLLRCLEGLFQGKGKKYIPYFELILLSFFLFLSQMRYSILRIFLYHLLSLILKKAGKKVSYLDRVSIVGLSLLILSPYSILSGSFYYPFPLLLTLGLFQKRRSKDRKAGILFFLFIFTFYLPYRMIQYGRLSLLLPFLQFLLLPVTHILFLSSFLLLLFPALGVFLSYVVNLLLYLLEKTAEVPFFLNVGSPGILFIILYYILLFFLLLFRTYSFQKLSKQVAIGMSVLFLTASVPDLRNHHEVTFIDVGQGDCTLLRYERMNILIDTGGNKSLDIAKECLIPYFIKQKITSLDAIIITHPDYDHNGALSSLEASFSIKNTYTADDFRNHGNTYSFGSLTIENLNEDPSTGKDNNDASGVYLFQVRKTKVLIMGDAPKEIEYKILQRHVDLKVDIIKLGHHGSKTSSSEEFLRQIKPRLAIISCGENNSYGHPHKETITTLESLGIPYRRTDEESTISISLT